MIIETSDQLKETSQADAYDHWFRQRVQATIDANQPTITHAQAKAMFAERRAKLAEKGLTRKDK